MTTWDEARSYSIDGLIRVAINGEPDTVETGEIADQVLSELWDAMEDDKEWALLEIRKQCREGIRRRVARFTKRARGVVRISGTGQVIQVPTHVGVAGGRAYQLRLWYELPWETFFRMTDDLARQRRILARDVKAFAEVAKMRERFPDSRTPGEACKMAGIDPHDFGLEDELAV